MMAGIQAAKVLMKKKCARSNPFEPVILVAGLKKLIP